MTKEIILSADQKSLQVNLDSKIYGTFIETGAGQEVESPAPSAMVPNTPVASPGVDVFIPQFRCRHDLF